MGYGLIAGFGLRILSYGLILDYDIMAFNKEWKSKGSWQKKETPSYKPKRGRLAPLMTEEQKKTAQIQELSYDFGCRMTRLYQYLTEDKFRLWVRGYGLEVMGYGLI